MSDLLVVDRRRAEEHFIGGAGEVLDHALRVAGRQVFEHFDANNQVVSLSQRLDHRAAAAKRTDVLVDLTDRVLGDVQPARVNAAAAQAFDQEPQGAAGIQDRGRVQFGNDPRGDLAEESEPTLVTNVGPSTTVRE